MDTGLRQYDRRGSILILRHSGVGQNPVKIKNKDVIVNEKTYASCLHNDE